MSDHIHIETWSRVLLYLSYMMEQTNSVN